jgi:hypothetical protein
MLIYRRHSLFLRQREDYLRFIIPHPAVSTVFDFFIEHPGLFIDQCSKKTTQRQNKSCIIGAYGEGIYSFSSFAPFPSPNIFEKNQLDSKVMWCFAQKRHKRGEKVLTKAFICVNII